MPEPLKAQPRIGGRLVKPVGTMTHVQELVRVTRVSELQYEKGNIGGVRFVPLVGAKGWAAPDHLREIAELESGRSPGARAITIRKVR